MKDHDLDVNLHQHERLGWRRLIPVGDARKAGIDRTRGRFCTRKGIATYHLWSHIDT